MTETAAHPDRALTVGLGVVAVMLISGVLFDALPYVAMAMAAIPLMATTLFYPKRALILLLGVQISLEFTQLDLASFYLGPLRTRLDDVLFWWILLLWLLCLPDGEGRTRTGATSRFLLLLVGVGFISFFWGLASGNDPGQVFAMFKNYPGYLAFFPAAWLISQDRKATGQVVNVIIAAGVIASLNIILRGYLRVDELVYERSTGLRVQARQAFGIGIGLLFLYLKALLTPKRLSLSLAVPSAVIMISAIILSQTRALWLGLILGAVTAAIIYSISERRRNAEGFGKVIGVLILCTAAFLTAGIAMQMLGFLEIADVYERTGSETGNYLTDATFLARAISWMEILSEVGNPPGLLIGKGMGYPITCFRIDYMRTITMSFVDGSYFQILLNAGLPGVVALLLLYIHGTVKSGTLALKEDDIDRKAVLLAVCASFIMLSTSSVLSSPITNYRFTILFGVLFALMAVRPGQAVDGGDLPERV